jgi:hypothetical protein
MTKIGKHAAWINVLLDARFRKVPQALGRQYRTKASWINLTLDTEAAIHILDLRNWHQANTKILLTA